MLSKDACDEETFLLHVPQHATNFPKEPSYIKAIYRLAQRRTRTHMNNVTIISLAWLVDTGV